MFVYSCLRINNVGDCQTCMVHLCSCTIPMLSMKSPSLSTVSQFLIICYWLISISHIVRSSLIVSWLIFHDYCWVAIIHFFFLLVTLHITPLLVESAMFAAMFCWWPRFFLTFSGWNNTRCGEIRWSKKAPKSQKGSSCRCYCLGGVAGSCVPGSKR